MGNSVNNIFSFSRFGMLLRKDFADNRKFYLLGALLVVGVISILFSWFGYLECDTHSFEYRSRCLLDPCRKVMSVTSAFCMYVFGILAASLTFSRLKTKTSRICDLMLPASRFEKYLLSMMLPLVYFSIVFIVSVVIADVVRWLILTSTFPEMESFRLFPFWKMFIVYDPLYTKFIFIIYFFLQSVFILGSAFMPRYSVLKTFAILIGLLILYGIVYSLLDLSSGKTVNPEGILLPMSCAVIINYVLAYLRYTETDVENRLL